jgi:ribosomal peptide maturation radical SAM protein 1
MTYRSRTSERVLEQFEELNRTYGISKFEVVDNILDMRHFDTLMPQLCEREFTLFYETKSNLKREHVAALRRAGVSWIQPGIESLHSNVLALMDKGAQAWMNLQLLKWSREYGLRLSWSLLFGFPTEDDGDYAEMAALVPKIAHLQPAGGMIHIRFDRYSPFHSKAEQYGLDLVPARLLKYAYPLSDADLADQSYFFEDRGAVDLGRNLSVGRSLTRPGADALRRVLADWSKQFWSIMPPLLCEEAVPGGLRVLDTREIAVERLVHLSGAAAAILTLCDSALSAASIPRRLAGQFSEAEIAEATAFLIERSYVVAIDGRLLSLTLRGDLPTLADGSEFPGGFVWRREMGTPRKMPSLDQVAAE